MTHEKQNYLLIISIFIGVGLLFGYNINMSLQNNWIRQEIRLSENTTTTAIMTATELSGDTKGVQPSGVLSNSNKETNKGSKKPVLNPLRSVWAWRDKATEYGYVIERMIDIGVESWTAEFIAWKCYWTAKDPKNCVKWVIWISTSESSLFKRCYMNNCFGIKPAWKIAWYDTLNLWIDDRVNRYNKNWYNNRTPDDYILRSHYCRSRDLEWNIVPWWCEDLVNGNWKRSFNSAISNLWI